MNRAMKDSGIEWIGEIPQEWEVIRVKNKYTNHKDIVGDFAEDYERLALTLNGVLKRSKDDSEGLQPESFKSYQILREKELVFKLIDLENVSTSRVGLSPFIGIVSPAYIIINNPEESAYGKYYFLSLWQREVFNHLGGDGVRSALNAKDLLKLPYLNVPSSTQELITDYLDNKCKEIDSIIENTKSTIEEYKKYKYAIIADIVTNGLAKNVAFRNSGVDWIGDIPGNWDVIKLKFLFSIKKEIANKLGYDILSVTQKGLKIKDISNNEGQISSDYSKYQIVEPKDFVMNHMDLLTGWVDCSSFSGVTSPDYRVFKLDDESKAIREYFLYIFQLCYKHRVFYGLGQGVSNMGRWRLQTDKFINFEVPLPPIEEQKSIVKYLNGKCSKIDNLISRKQKILAELESYKKSLIYECITGKLEV